MTLEELNKLDREQLNVELKKCCGSDKWLEAVASAAPFSSKQELFDRSDEAWSNCDEKDYREAFSHHPRIGDKNVIREKFAATAEWAEDEQAGIQHRPDELINALAECNRLYEEIFGYIFIINATGKSGEEILGSLRWRLLNTPGDEIKIAADEQNEITKIRLEKLLS